jgi:hypothetical protein
VIHRHAVHFDSGNVSATTSAGLDPHAAVGTGKAAVLHEDIMDAARSLATDDDASVRMQDGTVLDQDMFRCGDAGNIAPAFDGDTIVSHIDHATANRNRNGGFYIDAVRIRRIIWIGDGNIFQRDTGRP